MLAPIACLTLSKAPLYLKDEMGARIVDGPTILPSQTRDNLIKLCLVLGQSSSNSDHHALQRSWDILKETRDVFVRNTMPPIGPL
ncbi:hypothetical protein DPMN_079240 [Dreissena polymorpha]|uniref:Uncharacterized protein n=1 Tax=Dreissena polymorpha TaxID=45954 RepID=A0A9D3YST3_DREPO|nr:hypothetical protein DPMN_079240 [Dreissena polymorpha]